MAKQEKNFFTAVKILNGEAVEQIVDEKGEKGRRFYAIRRVQRASDYHPAYQIECVLTRDGKLIEQKLLGKPDTLAMVSGKLQEILDPTNSMESEDETNSIFA